jgi:polyphosphate glucokinase
MKRKANNPLQVLVIDVGGSHVKCVSTHFPVPARFKSGPKLAPEKMVEQVVKITRGWRYDVVTIGYPGVVRGGKITREPRSSVIT